MFDATLEDPATGSVASMLTGWLAQREGKGKWAAEIVQGLEMGRRSKIGIVVTIGDRCEIRALHFSGYLCVLCNRMQKPIHPQVPIVGN